LRRSDVESVTVSREVWSAPLSGCTGHGEDGSVIGQQNVSAQPRRWCGWSAAAGWVCLCGDGRSGLLGRLHDRGVAAGAARHLHLLLATQLIVLGIIALVDVNYWQLVGRFPLGGGSAEAAARAFGTGWVFLPIGALIVDFVLTITISIAAGISAVIAYLPGLASERIVLGLAVLIVVAGLTWFGHGGRLTFAVMTLLFIGSAVVILVVYLLVSAAVLVAASGREQELVLFYAVAVFVSFLAGLTAMTRFSLRDRRPVLAVINALGAISVAFTLVVNLGRGYPLLSLAATGLIALGLYLIWRRAGCPTGVEHIERIAEADA
jgi:hypothetical protein